ncbi:glycoside hydrolase [Trametopsis cervina]|nr:glycoside hydrolase [Trametopsis cervina]
MRLLGFATSCVALALPVVSQQIYDIFTTSWDRTSSFTYKNLGSSPINFVSPGAIGDADIQVADGTVYQTMFGHGSALTDSSAQLMSNLKNANSANYWSLLGYLFDPTDGKSAAGLSYLRVPIGASDFAAKVYSLDDTSGDTSLSKFNIDAAPSYLYNTIKDILSINPALKVHLLPWSPPGWMKDSGTMNGGNFLSQYSTPYANYLLKAVQGYKAKGINVYAVGIQNEPENSNPTYPTCKISASQEAAIGTTLRSLLNNNGLSSVKIVGYEHNWNDAGGYPVQLIQQANSAFSGVAFHCYSGTVGQQDTFHNAFPDKEIYFSECSGTLGSDWWSDIKWYIDNLYVGSVEHNSRSVLMWNLALDGNGQPELPGSNSCGSPPCRGVVTISGSNWSVNQEFYAMAHANKAIVPKDAGGPWGQRIGVSIGGSLNWALRVNAFVTHRNSASDWLRYSLVVLNWDDSASTTWNPKPVKTTIEFRGAQATYTFPVGVTTLWWFAAPTGAAAKIVNVGEPTVNINQTFTNGSAIPQYSQQVTWTTPKPSATGIAGRKWI